MGGWKLWLSLTSYNIIKLHNGEIIAYYALNDVHITYTLIKKTCNCAQKFCCTRNFPYKKKQKDSHKNKCHTLRLPYKHSSFYATMLVVLTLELCHFDEMNFCAFMAHDQGSPPYNQGVFALQHFLRGSQHMKNAAGQPKVGKQTANMQIYC